VKCHESFQKKTAVKLVLTTRRSQSHLARVSKHRLRLRLPCWAARPPPPYRFRFCSALLPWQHTERQIVSGPTLTPVEARYGCPPGRAITIKMRLLSGAAAGAPSKVSALMPAASTLSCGASYCSCCDTPAPLQCVKIQWLAARARCEPQTATAPRTPEYPGCLLHVTATSRL
jgi:hypothetical protein